MKEQLQEILDSLGEKTPRSRLAPYLDFIVALRRRKYTYREIRQILYEKCQVRISVSTLHDFLRTRKKATRAVRTTDVKISQKPQGKAVSERTSIPEENGKSASISSSDEIRQRIARLKQRPPQPEPNKCIFEYDPDQPLRLVSEDKKHLRKIRCR